MHKETDVPFRGSGHHVFEEQTRSTWFRCTCAMISYLFVELLPLVDAIFSPKHHVGPSGDTPLRFGHFWKVGQMGWG